MSAYISGPNVSAASPAASATILLNGSTIARIGFGHIAPEFPIQVGRLAPVLVKPAHVPMTPLFSPSALIFPVSSSYCLADHWQLGVVLKGATWPIDRVGIIARFAPAAASLGTDNPLVYVFAIGFTCALLFGTHALFDAVFKNYGPLCLLLTLGLFVCALLTHDEWDFPVWLRFVDLAALGHASPANMWGGTPLWPLGVSVLAPILSSFFTLTGNSSQEVSALVLKLAMALATAGNAYWLCRMADARLRRYLFPVLLLSPYALYELAGGYRELFAGSFFLLGASLALRGRFTFAALAFAAAASISESLAPLLFLPAALRVAGGGFGGRTLALAVVDIVAGVGPIVAQWLFLVPHGVVAATLATRVVAAYRFGGGSWLSTLDGFGILPTWAGTHSTTIMIVLAALLATPLLARIGRDVFANSGANSERTKRVFGNFLGLVAVFFLAYPGVDPSTWYTLWIVTAFYFIRFEQSVRFPLFLSIVQAVAFYAILGIGDFANVTYIMPSNESLLGVLGKPMLVCVMAVNLAILALYVSRIGAGSIPFFGRGSTWFMLLFFGAVGAGSIKLYPIDTFFCSSVAIVLLIVFTRLGRFEGYGRNPRRLGALDFLGIASTIVAGAFGGTQNQAATLVAFVAVLLGVSFGFGTCDLIMVLAGTLLVGTQYGFGWVSIAGYIVVSLLAVASIGKALAVARFRNA
jgi:hypothetical protein